MSFKPLADNVLIRVAGKESTTSLGVIRLDSSKEKPTRGEVVAVGSGTLVKDGTKYPIEVSEGDQVLFKEGAGVDVDIDGVSHLVVREYDILGII